MLTYQEAVHRLSTVRPARKKRERYEQRDNMQRRIIPLLPAEDRDAFERLMNDHFRL